MKSLLRKAGRRLAGWSSFTRQGVLDSARKRVGATLAPPARTTLVLVTGSVLIGAGVASFRAAKLGLPPYDVFLSAISAHSPLSHGQAGWLTAAVLMIIAMAMGQRLVAGSVLLVFANGLSVDAASKVIVDAPNMVTQLALFAFGMTALAAGLALVVFSGKGRGPFEMLMAAGSARGFRETNVRTTLEVSVLVAGVAAGGDLGPGTLLFALAIGPLLGAMLQALADHRSGRLVRQSAPAGG